MNIFNKKTILFFSISTLMINGCVSKQELQIRPHNMAVIKVKPLISKSIWNKTLSPNIKKEDCIDCYATPMNYSKPPLATTKTIAKVIKTKRYGAYDYTETEADTTVKANNYASVNVNQYILPAVSTINSPYSSYDTYSHKKWKSSK